MKSWKPGHSFAPAVLLLVTMTTIVIIVGTDVIGSGIVGVAACIGGINRP
jgi:hypothetical protein